MDGCKLIVISGIDGCHAVFNQYIKPYLYVSEIYYLSYNRRNTFVENIQKFSDAIKCINGKVCIVGWSIGAVAAVFLASQIRMNCIIMINAFFSRSEVLARRNIICEEEVCINNISIPEETEVVLISGKKDSKIPFTESNKIQKYLNLSSNNLFTFEEADHDIQSFPRMSIANIINKYAYEKYDYNS